ncbi:phage major capsid protein [Streptosporangium sp. NBC_01495]|uniref:phage major capsid protein n=1 Tax=Streptosporangium sp. NBC_01495 TaxID=2903899 RepID=UPI002E33330F|nr:phage major capsid protein [Streptosporangium sp. NBC_01495]
MTLEEMRARLAEIETERRTMDETAGDAALTGDARSAWEALDTEESDLRAQVDEAERRGRVAESRARWQTAQIGSRVTPFDGDPTRMERRELADQARAVLGDDEHGGHLADEQRTRLERLLQTRNDNVDGAMLARRLLVTEHPDYRAAFMRLVSRATPVLTPDQSRAVERFEEFRAMNIGTDASGGYGVPVLIDPTIILTAQGSPNDFFNLARVETITTDTWKGVSSAGVTWQFRQEGAAASDNSPTLDQPAVPVHRADGYIPYSLEVDQDYPGFAAEMSRLLGEGYSELLVNKLTTGSGTNEPTGIVTALDAAAGSEVATGTAGTIAAADVNKVWAALPIRYRRNSAWMSSTGVNNVFQQLGSGNDAAFTTDFTAEGVLILKGRRAYLNDYMAAPAVGTAAANLAVVGDWSNYLIAQRAGMSIELIPHVFNAAGTLALPTGQRAWFAWARVGADSINDAGFRLLQNKTV